MTAGQRLITVCGLPGVGKSSVAKAVTDRLGCTRLRTDVVRKELISEPTYSEAETERVYTEFLNRAEQRVTAGESVVLDATFRKQTQRKRAQTLGVELDVPFTLIHVVCDDDVVEQRIRIREDISDADVSVYRQLKSEFEPIQLPHETIDNSGTREATKKQIQELF